MKKFSKVAIVGRLNTPGIADTLANIGQALKSQSIQVFLDQDSAHDCEPDFRKQGSKDWFEAIQVSQIAKACDLAIVVGGDGTMLGLARQVVGSEVALLGINHGRVGFITDLPLSSWQTALRDILAGQYREEHRSLLLAQVMRNGKPVFSAPALNDVVVTRNNSGRMIEVTVDVDSNFMYTQRADGLIVSTPTGSTAYALSANGPILHPSLAGMVLVPVAPQSLSNRPIVIPESSRISIHTADAEEVQVHCDMQVFTDLQENDVIEVRLHPHRVRFIHPMNHSYFATLRQKLNWHATPSAPY